MKRGKWTRILLRALLVLAALTAIVILDWHPTVRELSRLRREHGDLKRGLQEYRAMAASFNFPDAQEKLDLVRAKLELRRALPQVDRDEDWEAIVLAELQALARKDQVPSAMALFTTQAPGTEFGSSGRRGDLLAGWLFPRQAAAIAAGFSTAVDPNGYPWHGVLTDVEFRRGQRLASRPLVVVLAAPLPALLNFINHISWGAARLEIVGLRLDPGLPLSRAWLVCRGNYLVHVPSAHLVAKDPGSKGASLLIDPNSPLLWQKVAPAMFHSLEKKELPPAGSPW